MSTNTPLHVDSPLANDAVLQRQLPVTLWGRAAAGEVVEVDFAGQRERAEADASGRWRVTLEPMEACATPRCMVVRSLRHAPEQGLRFDGLLVGEVWLASGQSNMELRLRESAERDTQPDALVRLCRLPVLAADAPADSVAANWRCAPADFSAVAYHFACELRRELEVPVGVIGAYLGSTGIACWLSNAELAAHADGDALAAQHNERVAHFRWALEARQQAEDPMSIWLGHDPLLLRPSGLFHSMIAPLQPWAMRGVIWYQGEADANSAANYETLLRRLIASWRQGWHDDQLAFLVVQLSAFDAKPTARMGDWPAIRQAQARVTDSVPRTALVVSIDMGERHNIHPTRKRVVGHRLAWAALNMVHGRPVAWRAPRPIRAVHDNGVISIHFDDPARGITTSDRSEPRGLVVLTDQGLVPFPGLLREGAIGIAYEQQAREVLYAWTAWTDANLVTNDGLPVAPFRIPVTPARHPMMNQSHPLPPARRCAVNPIIRPADLRPTRDDLEVCCVMNAGALRRDGVTYLMLRVDERPIPQEGYVSTAISHGGRVEIMRVRKDMSGLKADDPRGFVMPDGRMFITVLSHLRLARSCDGVNFVIDDEPAISPSEPYAAYAAQDSRMTEISGTVYINYSAVSDHGIATALVTTKDFATYQHRGLMFAPDNRNVCIFPRAINGWYYALHRPMHAVPIGLNSVWLARSKDLVYWGDHRRVMAPRSDGWDNHRVGGGAPPIETPDGWLIVYHGSSVDNRYCLGAALLDRDDPSRVLARHPLPLLEPEMEYERKGFFGNVVFTDGALVQDGLLRVYYGASDEVTCLADFDLDDLLNALRGSTTWIGSRPGTCSANPAMNPNS